MAMLAELVEVVIGIDTHKHPHTAAIVAAATGAIVHQATVAATPVGSQQLLGPAERQPGRRGWAIQGTGGSGAGPTRFLQATVSSGGTGPAQAGRRRHGARSAPIDASRAAREALAREQLAQPQAAGQPAALSVRLAARRSAVQATTDEDSAADGAACQPSSWSPPVGGCVSEPSGTPRPPRPRPVSEPCPPRAAAGPRDRRAPRRHPTLIWAWRPRTSR